MKKNIWKETVLDTSSSIKDAFLNLEKTGLQIIFICSNDKLLATVTDGDIRRSLLKKVNYNQKLIKIANKNPITSTKKISLAAAKKIMSFNQINYLPIINNQGKLIDVYSKNELDDNSQKYDVVIMAGGFGKRLLPITKTTPKAMINYNGKPLLEAVINQLIKFGFFNFFLSVNYLKKKIKDYFGDGKNFGINIKYLEEKKPLGTVGSLSLIKETSENFIVINCDIITNLNFSELIKFHEDSNSDVTIAASIVENRSSFGELKVKGNKVLSFDEKPVERKYNNSGIYVFKKIVLNFISKNKKLNMNTFIKLLIKKNLNINIFPMYENWIDLGIKTQLK